MTLHFRTNAPVTRRHLPGWWKGVQGSLFLSAAADISYKELRLYFHLHRFVESDSDLKSDSDRLVSHFDTAVTGAFDVAALDDIPDGDMVTEQHGSFLLNCLRSFFFTKLRQQFPESILFMSVVEIIFPGFYRRKSSKNQNLGVFIIYWFKGMGDVFIFHGCAHFLMVWSKFYNKYSVLRRLCQ